MSDPNKFIGRATIEFDGKKVATMPGASLDLGGVERKEIVLADGAVGYSETPKASEMECEVPVSAETPFEDYQNLVNATVTFRCDTGQTFMVRNGFRKATLKFAAKEGGNMKIVIAGNPAEKV